MEVYSSYKAGMLIRTTLAVIKKKQKVLGSITQQGIALLFLTQMKFECVFMVDTGNRHCLWVPLHPDRNKEDKEWNITGERVCVSQF